jgi:ribosomal subunit interface protein
MKNPLQITFRNMDPSEAMEADVREKAAKLDEFFTDIMSCRVVVESLHHSHHKGNLYHVRIHITVPGEKEIVVSREPVEHHAHEDAYVAIRDAFDAARRQLQDHARQVRQDVKHHEQVPHGRIRELVPAEDYGRIQSSDGREIYFHRNSVVNADFDKLEEGMEVRFAEEQGDAGPQASSVQLVGKHHIVD